MFYILGLALVLRLILINQSLWLDEAIQALALRGQMGPLLSYALADFQPPLYHGLGWLWTQLFGYSEIALRGPSLLAGIGTVYFTSKIGHFLGGKKLEWLAGLLAATNPLLIYYSQEGRTYSLTTFFVTAAMYYFIVLLKKSTNKHNIVLYTLFSIFFLWTSYLTWFLHLALFLYTLKEKRRDLLIPQIIAGLTLFFWLPSLISSLGIGLATVSSSPAWGQVVGGISLKALALTWVKFLIGRISFDPSWLYGVIVLTLTVLHLMILRRLSFKQISPTLFIWLSSIIIIALVSLVIPVYSYTRLLFVLPSYLLILALGLNQLKSSWTWGVIAGQLFALVVFWVSPTFHREAWRSVVDDNGKTATYALPSRNQNAPLLYYGVADAQILEPKDAPTLPSASKIVYLKYVENIFDITGIGASRLLQAGYQLEAQKVYPGLQVDIYTK